MQNIFSATTIINKQIVIVLFLSSAFSSTVHYSLVEVYGQNKLSLKKYFSIAPEKSTRNFVYNDMCKFVINQESHAEEIEFKIEIKLN